MTEGNSVVTLVDCHTRQAQVDAGVKGIITSVYVSYGIGYQYAVEFVNCIHKGRWTGRKTWYFGANEIKLI